MLLQLKVDDIDVLVSSDYDNQYSTRINFTVSGAGVAVCTHVYRKVALASAASVSVFWQWKHIVFKAWLSRDSPVLKSAVTQVLAVLL